MPTQNIIAGSLTGPRRSPSVSAVADTGTFTALQFVNGINVAAGGSEAAPTPALLGAYFFARGGINVGDSFMFVNQTSDGTAATLTANGNTLVGSGVSVAAAGRAAAFRVICTAAPTDAAGTGAAFSICRS